MGSLIKFEYIGTTFIVQSYLKNNFANICEVNGESFRVDFKNGSITTSAKETPDWKSKKRKIDITELQKILDRLIAHKNLQKAS